jgi:hypothetical protein
MSILSGIPDERPLNICILAGIPDERFLNASILSATPDERISTRGRPSGNSRRGILAEYSGGDAARYARDAG